MLGGSILSASASTTPRALATAALKDGAALVERMLLATRHPDVVAWLDRARRAVEVLGG